MSEGRHSPGPWRAGSTPSIFPADGGPRIAEVSLLGRSAAECVANTRLICAAPELLAACVAMVEGEDALRAEMDPAELARLDLEHGVWSLVDAMRAAIAKATGTERG